MYKKSNIYLRIINNYLIDGKINGNISYLYNFGVLLGVSFMIQIVTGILCTFYYISTISDCFNSIEILMREISNGSTLRYILSNGVSLIFICLYIHIMKGLYYNSYIKPRSKLFITGIIILLISIIIAFLGYSLVGGIQSYWAIVVITNLLSAIPFIGNDLVILIWSNYSPSTLTIRRFFTLLYLLPFILLGLMLTLIISLLELNGTTIIGISGNIKMLSFLSYFTLKDVFPIFIYILIITFIIQFIPNKLEDPENNIEFNVLVTPNQIVPLWYLLPFYAILRSITNKLLGVIFMILAILIFLILPYNNTLLNRSNRFNILFKYFFYSFINTFIMLLILGAKLASEPFITIAQLLTFYYFFYLIFLIPTIGIILNTLFFYL